MTHDEREQLAAGQELQHMAGELSLTSEAAVAERSITFRGGSKFVLFMTKDPAVAAAMRAGVEAAFNVKDAPPVSSNEPQA